jgi:hypothetical protein
MSIEDDRNFASPATCAHRYVATLTLDVPGSGSPGGQLTVQVERPVRAFALHAVGLGRPQAELHLSGGGSCRRGSPSDR